MCIKCLLIAILFDIYVTGGSSSDHCKDVDVVSVLPDYSTSAIVRTSSIEAVGGICQGNGVVIGKYRVHQRKITKNLRKSKWMYTLVPNLDGLIGPTYVTLTSGASSG